MPRHPGQPRQALREIRAVDPGALREIRAVQDRCTNTAPNTRSRSVGFQSGTRAKHGARFITARKRRFSELNYMYCIYTT
jgi:hypothetical protein